MNFVKTKLDGVFIIEPKIFGDQRGYFVETYRQDAFEQQIASVQFIQDNESKSNKGVLRGLHYQKGDFAQAKLVRVVCGAVLDVAVDIRPESPTFGQHVAVELNEDNKRQLFVPRGFAHGFVVLQNNTLFCYKVDNIYAPQHEAGIRYDDPNLAIDWRIDSLLLSDKDKQLPFLADVKF